MARQYLQDGPFIDPQVASGSALVGTTAVDLWAGTDFTPIFARDPKAGKIYIVEAEGIMSTSASASTLTLGAGIGTSSPGTTLGVSQAQTMVPSLTAIPWSLRLKLTVRTIGAKGANSTIMGVGQFLSGGAAATGGSGIQVAFGGTSALFDATVENFITIQKTLSVAGSMTLFGADIFSRN